MDRLPDFSDSPEGITKGNHQYEVVVLAPWTAILRCLEVLMNVSSAALKAVLCEDAHVGADSMRALDRGRNRLE